MTHIEKNISAGQYFKNVFPKGIPANAIINKTITGCGATTCEIDSNRHSIIIVPNVPVIQGKMKKHPFLLGVFEGVTIRTIEQYLNDNWNDGYLKIMTTPESYSKVTKAIRNTRLELYLDFFMLFDECEKIIQDIGYRGSITLPINDFFKFKNKAMISATPIPPSDPRFVDFDLVQITPTYNYAKQSILYLTNNTVGTLRNVIALSVKQYQNAPICIFLNSTDTIFSLIQRFKLETVSKVFCGEDSVKKLKQLGYDPVASELSDLAPINFLTSRFYSAVDIDVAEHKPLVIVLTDVFRAKQTMVDPNTEVVQIAGRFRNGITGLVHISNCDIEMTALTQKEVLKYLNECEATYKTVALLPTTGSGSVDTKQQALEGMDYKRYVNADGSRNCFMWDNALFDERVKGYYTSKKSLQQSYDRQHFDLMTKHVDWPLGDEDRLRITKSNINTTDLFKEMVVHLERLTKAGKSVKYGFLIEELKAHSSMMVEAYFYLGKEVIEQLGYNKAKITKELKKTTSNQMLLTGQVLGYVYEKLAVGDVLTVANANKFIKNMLAHFAIPYAKKITSELMKNYFDIKESRVKDARKLTLLKRKHATPKVTKVELGSKDIPLK